MCQKLVLQKCKILFYFILTMAPWGRYNYSVLQERSWGIGRFHRRQSWDESPSLLDPSTTSPIRFGPFNGWIPMSMVREERQKGRGEKSGSQLFPFFLSFLLVLPFLILPCYLSVKKYLLRVYHLLGSVLGTWDRVWKRSKFRGMERAEQIIK